MYVEYASLLDQFSITDRLYSFSQNLALLYYLSERTRQRNQPLRLLTTETLHNTCFSLRASSSPTKNT